MVTHILGLRLEGSQLSIPAVHRRRTLSVLTRLQSASAAALGAFGVVHLSAPLVGLLHLGGDVNDRVDAVSRWMLLGRVAYQSSIGEAVLWAALATHLVSGVAKRLVTRFTVARSATEPSEVKQQAALEEAVAVPTRAPAKLSMAQKSGYVLAPFVIHHAFVNRILPSSSKPPISNVSPSELDYSFVAHTLSHTNTAIRIFSATAYTVLIGAFAVHTVYAVPALLRMLPKSSNGASDKVRKPKRRSQTQVASSLAIVLLASLFAIVPFRSSDKLTVSGALKDRYDAVLGLAFPTRFFLQST
ncbi:protein of unknown function DUF1691 [Kalmanozyma brasiliensis GHG001]|uniref:protein of unknown function DUF1691 n=1 Tax=Kalmanozyma brasiliensis (strain GHG001) TaxID=1365824 RepID=UPI0028681664|nr:protein of unknown function DUF1691 [Kalmanozyma brasiliensis GHG001]KAF6767386.1 protein of unknown function DUF1691 [Kalmanozyma brasiliensis GHG001]